MISENHSDSILNSKDEALVCPVNCFGILRTGLGSLFKQEYPDYFKHYKEQCEIGDIKLGQVDVFERQPKEPKCIISFPTKQDHKDKPKMFDVEEALDDLVATVEDYDIVSISIPKLGCGIGGLKWDVVKDLIKEKFEPLTNCKVTIYNFDND